MSRRSTPESRDVVAWDTSRGVIVAQRERRIGELVIDAKPLASITDEARVALLARAIRAEGLLPRMMSEAARGLQARVVSLGAWGRADSFPDFSDDALLATISDWMSVGP